jgi:hypothetical protein
MKRNHLFFLSCCFVQVSFSTNLTFEQIVEKARLSLIERSVAKEKSSQALGLRLMIAADQGDVEAVIIILKKKAFIAQSDIDEAVAKAKLHGHTTIIQSLKGL